MGRVESFTDGATVLGQGSGTNRLCPLCLGSDHLKEDCVLSAMEVAKQGVIPQAQRLHPGRQARCPTPYRPPTGSRVCYRFTKVCVSQLDAGLNSAGR